MSNLHDDAAKGIDLRNFLDDIAWEGIICPELDRAKLTLTNQLVTVTLSGGITIQTATGPKELTREQIAGKIYGIDFIKALLEKILEKGQTALQTLRKSGYNIE